MNEDKFGILAAIPLDKGKALGRAGHTLPRQVLKKQCQCRGTSSGPRFTQMDIAQKREGDMITFTARQGWSQMVCDVCETAWRWETIE